MSQLAWWEWVMFGLVVALGAIAVVLIAWLVIHIIAGGGQP